MTALTDSQAAECFNAGIVACQANAPRAPACSNVVMAIVAALSSPDFANHDAICKAMNLFRAGYKAQCDIDCAAIIAA